MSAQKSVLQQERDKIDFDRAELEAIMQQNPELYKQHKKIQKFVEEDPLLRLGLDIYALSKEEKLEQGFRRTARINANMMKHFGQPVTMDFGNLAARYVNASVSSESN